MDRPPEIVKTERLLLRMPVKADAEGIFQGYAQDAHITTWLAWQPHKSIDETIEFVASRILEWETGPRYSWVIMKDSEPLILGMLSIRWPLPYRISMSYVIRRDVWGNGYATEAAQAIINWALGVPEVHRVEAFYDVENHASARVLEKTGMIKEGILRRAGFTPNISTGPRDCMCCSIIKES